MDSVSHHDFISFFDILESAGLCSSNFQLYQLFVTLSDCVFGRFLFSWFIFLWVAGSGLVDGVILDSDSGFWIVDIYRRTQARAQAKQTQAQAF